MTPSKTRRSVRPMRMGAAGSERWAGRSEPPAGIQAEFVLSCVWVRHPARRLSGPQGRLVAPLMKSDIVARPNWRLHLARAPLW